MVETLKAPSPCHIAMVDLDDTLAPTLKSMADWMQEGGTIWTREQIMAVPLGHNTYYPLDQVQREIIRNPDFIHSLSPFNESSVALRMLNEHNIPYFIWSARVVKPEEARLATIDWITENFRPPPERVLLKAEPRLPGAIFKPLAYIGILEGLIDDGREKKIIPVVAFEDDRKAAKILTELGLNVFLIRRSEERSSAAFQSIPLLHGPYESMVTAVTDFLYLWEKDGIAIPNLDSLSKTRRRNFIPRHLMHYLFKEGLFSPNFN